MLLQKCLLLLVTHAQCVSVFIHFFRGTTHQHTAFLIPRARAPLVYLRQRSFELQKFRCSRVHTHALLLDTVCLYPMTLADTVAQRSVQYCCLLQISPELPLRCVDDHAAAAAAAAYVSTCQCTSAAILYCVIAWCFSIRVMHAVSKSYHVRPPLCLIACERSSK